MLFGKNKNIINFGDGSTLCEMLGRREMLGSSEKLSLSRITAQVGYRDKCHYHKTFDELYYMIRGRGLLTVNGAPQPLEEGGCILVQRGEKHFIQIPNQPLEFIVVCTPA